MSEQKRLLKRLVADLKVDVPNLEATVGRVSIEAIEAAGSVQSSFAEFNSLILSDARDSFHRHSAFCMYHIDATFFSRRGLREALCSYYGPAGSLLRGTCEAILKGAFWECLAHKRHRDHAEILNMQKRKIEGTPRNVLDWLEGRFQARPDLEAPLENESSGMLDIVTPLFETKAYFPAVPSLKMMVEQLNGWKMFEPMADPVSEIYDDLYAPLCEDTHLIPAKTMMGRLILAGKDASELFEPSQEEFDRFVSFLHRLAEMGALALLNVLEDDSRADDVLRAKIAAMQPVAEGISLPRVVERIQALAK
ncbi:MAG TPA: hypothetical protein VIX59_15695 [Candidatus Binataceae bacterium]